MSICGEAGDRPATPPTSHSMYSLPTFWPDWVVMVLPAGGFLTLGFIILAMGYYEERKAERMEQTERTA